MSVHLQTSTLYDQDYYQWIETTVKQIRDRNFENVDWENLLEELDSLGKRDRREVSSRLTLILAHLLKWSYQPSERSFYGNSWISTIIEQRNELRLILADSPSLKNYLLEQFDSNYATARKSAAKETGLPLDTFPDECPFTPDQTLDLEYMPVD